VQRTIQPHTEQRHGVQAAVWKTAVASH
jgi:hypothetical protein